MRARLSFSIALAATVAILDAPCAAEASGPALDALPVPIPVTRCEPLTIPFDADEARLPASAEPALGALAKCLITSGRTVSIEGHTEERGTPEYAIAIAERRAKVVANALVALGVARARIRTLSYGHERPVCTEATEACRAKNRRAEVVPE